MSKDNDAPAPQVSPLAWGDPPAADVAGIVEQVLGLTTSDGFAVLLCLPLDDARHLPQALANQIRAP